MNSTGLLVGLAVLALVGFGSQAHAQTVSVYVQEMPRNWQAQFADTLESSIQYWEQKMPGLKFEYVQQIDDSDFVIEWTSNNANGMLGYYSEETSNQYGKPVMAITLGFFKDGKLQMLLPESALQITKHELGHAIGISHTENPDDLMYHTVDDYESIQPLEQIPDYSASKDWQASSAKYQKLADEKISLLGTKISDIKSVLGTIPYGNKSTEKTLNDSWMAYWWAVKYLDLAKKAQANGTVESEPEKSYSEFKLALDYANKAEQKLAFIDESIQKINGMAIS